MSDTANRNILYSIVNAGILPGFTFVETKNIRAVNVISLVIIIINLLYSVVTYFLLIESFPINVAAVIIGSLIIYFNHRHMFRVAINLMLWGAVGVIFTVCMLLGKEIGGEYYFFGVFAGMLLFVRTPRYSLYIFAISLSSFVLLKMIYNHFPPVVETAYAGYFFYPNIVLSFTIAFVSIYFIKQENIEHIKTITEKNTVLQLQKTELEQQYEQLSAVDATKDKLFSIISHDLRSPIGNLRRLLEMLPSEEVSHNEFISYTKHLKGNVDTIYTTLENLLYWSKSQQRGLVTTPQFFNMRKIIEQVLSLFTDVAVEKNIKLKNHVLDDVNVFADADQIMVVMRNLVSNAIKFSPPFGTIDITIVANDTFAEISVADTGVGMKSDEVGRLFSLKTHFSKSGTQGEKGVGLGLLLCKEMVEQNGGAIRIESEYGKGTIFFLNIPRMP